MVPRLAVSVAPRSSGLPATRFRSKKTPAAPMVAEPFGSAAADQEVSRRVVTVSLVPALTCDSRDDEADYGRSRMRNPCRGPDEDIDHVARVAGGSA